MQIHFNIWVIIFLVALFQGTFLGVGLLVAKPAKLPGKSMLALLVLVFSLILLEELIEEARLYPSFPHFIKISALLPFLFGPLLYLHLRLVSKPLAIKFTNRHLLHFAPFALALLWHIPFYLSSGHYKLASFQMTPSLIAWVYTKFAHILIYSILIIKYLRGLQSSNNFTSYHLWFSRAFTTFAVSTVAVYALFSLYLAGIHWWHHADKLGGLFMAISIYALSWVALNYSSKKLYPIDESPPKYQNSTLNNTSKNQLQRQLIALLEQEKPYLNPEISLNIMARLLEVKPHLLSQVINETMEKNFYELINQYRVQEVQKKLKDSSQQHKTLLAIAFESGFNNKTSFNKSFKEIAGMTPSAFKKSIQSGQ